MANRVDLEKQQRNIEEPPRTPSSIRSPAMTSEGSEHPRDSVADDQTVVDTPGSPDEVDAPGEPKLDEKTERSQYLVKWDGPDDPENPKNWSRAFRWYLTMASGLLILNATFASSSPSGVLPQLIQEFHLGHELAVLTISLFVVGYCCGPLVWGPLSEQYGRKPILLVAFFIYTGFQVGSALAKTTAQVLIFRFLGGTFAAAPLTASGAILADIWDADVRGKALAFFTLAPFAGPALGPVVSGYISVGGASWRWLFWVLTMFAGFCFCVILFTMPETYAPAIHKRKAIRKRKETGNDKYISELEAEDLHWKQRLENVLARPFTMLIREPMLMAITLYMSFVYGCIYLLFESYPIVFTEGHHLNAGESGLMFLPIFLGGILGVVIYILYFNPRYEKLIPIHAPRMVPPEQRLKPAFLGAPMFVIVFFWFGWTSYPRISLWAPMLSGLFVGCSVIFIFLSLFNYIIDAYLMVSASALASNTVVRSAFGAGFPLFATQMYNKLNPRWASTLLGFIALIMVPIPFVLFKFGPRVRRTSKYAPTFD
ncbi:hypothetical protein M407DRAFT_245224 [Tulasnella calospora MUT 4182]|uniref:Major facilitator superfamily (MFS) profile domain-containing protein n=1 Tax=Tulasnella calospora MUT 4182 TaxID=1051891 RepID=A0A0C3Q1U8_9AGAM|nr:hypothetical protein M407DRAFT_245224 [Tulasnella calospora MUT 4182]